MITTAFAAGDTDYVAKLNALVAEMNAAFVALGGTWTGLSKLTKNVAGNSNVTLTDEECAHLIIELTGALTGNINVIVPAEVGLYSLYNNTTGAFVPTVKTPLGTGLVAAQGGRQLLMCDGTNVVDPLASAGSAMVTAYNRKLTKRASSPGSSPVATFTIRVTTDSGYKQALIMVRAFAADGNGATATGAWWLYSVLSVDGVALTVDLVDSGGTTGSYVVSINGDSATATQVWTLTVTATNADHLTCDAEITHYWPVHSMA